MILVLLKVSVRQILFCDLWATGWGSILHQNYCLFSPWYYKQNLAKKKEIILMQDTAPSHSSKFTNEYLANRDLMEDQDHGLASKFCRPQSNWEPLEHRDTEGFLGWKAVFIQRKPNAGHFWGFKGCTGLCHQESDGLNGFQAFRGSQREGRAG